MQYSSTVFYIMYLVTFINEEGIQQSKHNLKICYRYLLGTNVWMLTFFLSGTLLLDFLWLFDLSLSNAEYISILLTFALAADISGSPAGSSTTSTIPYEPSSRSGTITFYYVANTYSDSNQGSMDYLDISTCRDQTLHFTSTWTHEQYDFIHRTSVDYSCASAGDVQVRHSNKHVIIIMIILYTFISYSEEKKWNHWYLFLP